VSGASAGLSPDRVARRDVVRTFQPRSLFESRTVPENAWPALQLAWIEGPPADTLDLAGLSDDAGVAATESPTEKGRRLAIATAVAVRPAVLKLDEPAAELAPSERTPV
jgi:branched-chain amino acid transport system ATP-binding protein